MKMVGRLAIVVAILGVVGIIAGGIFLWQGFGKYTLIVDRMKLENVSLALDPNNPQVLTPIDNSSSAQAAADKIAADRRKIAPSYQDLLKQSNGRFDPTIPQEVSYAQAMNLENYLYMAVTAFGLTEAVMGSGGYMVVVGAAVLLTGLALRKVNAPTV
jgi:hypothetical protein